MVAAEVAVAHAHRLRPRRRVTSMVAAITTLIGGTMATTRRNPLHAVAHGVGAGVAASVAMATHAMFAAWGSAR